MPYTTVVAGTTITATWGNQMRDQSVTPFASANARDSAIASPVEGMLEYLADSDQYVGYNGVGWQTAAFLPGFLFARKTVDESLTSSATLQNDDHLFVSVAANAVYLVDAFLLYSSDAAADAKIGWTAPAGATLIWNSAGLSTAASAGSPSSATWYGGANLTTTDLLGGVGAGTDCVARPSGILVTSGTPGPFQLQWAQGGSSATPTVFRTNSFLMLRRVA